MMALPKLGTISHQIKSLQAFTTTIIRGGRGNMGSAHPIMPDKMLVLYEHEACPYCRRVREVMTHLNLDYESRPSPHKGHVYRDELKSLTGKTQVPYLIDDNTDIQLLESQDIIDHLYTHYSKLGTTPKRYRDRGKDGASFSNKLASVTSMLRGAMAVHPKKNKARGKPEHLLELYNFEASPFSRLVREKLSQLEVGFINRNVARERLQDNGLPGLHLTLGKYQPIKGGKRDRIMTEVMGGKSQFPYLIDPNTHTTMFESQAIIAYLDQTYG